GGLVLGEGRRREREHDGERGTTEWNHGGTLFGERTDMGPRPRRLAKGRSRSPTHRGGGIVQRWRCPPTSSPPSPSDRRGASSKIPSTTTCPARSAPRPRLRPAPAASARAGGGAACGRRRGRGRARGGGSSRGPRRCCCRGTRASACRASGDRRR